MSILSQLLKLSLSDESQNYDLSLSHLQLTTKMQLKIAHKFVEFFLTSKL